MSAAESGPSTPRSTRPKPSGETSISELRRQQILDAAEQCFGAHGFHAASMAEIARTFGMSAGHIYNYFDSKEAIIAGIVERDLGEFFRRAAELRRAEDLQRALLERIDAGVADKLNQRKAALQIEVLAEASRNPCVAQMVHSVDARVRAVLRQLLLDGPLHGRSSDDVDAKVEVLMALFDGLMVRGLRHPGLDKGEVTRELRTTIQRLLQG